MTEPDLSAQSADVVPAPVVTGGPEQIADGVYVIPDRMVSLVPNVGIIIGERAALVIDTGMGPVSGAHVHQVARELAGERPLYLTITHFHPEHGYGAQAFAGATILYNRQQHAEFKQKAEGYLQTFRDLGSEIATQLDGVEFVEPHVVYETAADLDLGGKVVQLRSWGAAHSRGDQVVFLPGEGVLFTGDLVEDGFFPIFPFFPPYDTDVDGGKWLEVLAQLQSLAPRIVVPGHGKVGDASLIDAYAQYIEELRTETTRLAAEGKDAEAIVAILQPRLLAKYSGWELAEPWRIATAVASTLSH